LTDPRDVAAQLYDEAAVELDLAAKHDVLEAQARLENQARQHATKSAP
jgi:hypothetical protein